MDLLSERSEQWNGLFESNTECAIRRFFTANSGATWEHFRKGRTSVELVLGRKLTLQLVTDFDPFETFLFKPTSSSPTVAAT